MIDGLFEFAFALIYSLLCIVIGVPIVYGAIHVYCWLYLQWRRLRNKWNEKGGSE